MKSFKNANTLYDLKYGAAPTYNPESKSFYYAYSYFDKTKQDYRSDIYLYNIETATDEVLIKSGGENYSPVYQNDYLLYLSDDNKTKKPQVHSYHVKKHTQQVLTNTEDGVSHVEWIPNTESFLFTTSLRLEEKTTDPKENPYARKIKTLNYQADGTGFVDEEKKNYLCEQKLNEENYTVIGPQSTGYGLRRIVSVSSDSRYIYFERQVEPNSEWNQDSAVFVYDRQTAETSKLTAPFEEGIFSEAAASPDGHFVALVGSELPYETNNQFDLYLYNTQTKTFQNLSEALDIQFADNSVSDFYQHVTRPLIQWASDSQSFYVQTSEYGDVLLYQISLNGDMKLISEKGQVLKEYLVLENGDILASTSRFDKPFTWQLFNGETWRYLTSDIEVHYHGYLLATYQEVQYQAEDGGVIHGYLVQPPNFDASKQYPLILNIHGGPYAMHASNFFHEAQYMAANGYCVLLINPRGSYGYGQDHVLGVYERYGKEDYTDLTTAVSEVCKEYSFIDENNLFVTGGSYGGFMTNWIITQDHRFRAAASQRSMSNFVSLFSTSDIGYFFFRDQIGADITEIEKMWKNSPQAYADQVKTPLLLLHPLNDYRCPFEQAQQFYTSLKYFGKETEMLVFYHASHELSRSGHPEQRIQRLEGIINWFNRYYAE